MFIASRSAVRLALVATIGALASISGLAEAQQHQEEARVVSTSQASDGSYNVVYEYAGKRYNTRTETAPGRTLPIQISAIGVTTAPVYQSSLTPNQGALPGSGNGNGQPWDNVVPEPGVVVSGNDQAQVYAQPQYVQPVYAAPVYVQPGYAYPYYASPVGISLNLGYSRGWGGGWHRGWR